MPYKDPERKRQWESEHRHDRNARRRSGTVAQAQEPKPTSDIAGRLKHRATTPNSKSTTALPTDGFAARLRALRKAHDPKPEAASGWVVILIYVAAFALAFAGISSAALPDPGTEAPGPG